MTIAKKNSAALAMVLFFTFGAIAVSFAASDPSSFWFSPGVNLHKAIDKAGHSEHDGLKTCVLFEGKGLPNSSHQFSGRHIEADGGFHPPPIISFARRIDTRKVSLQIFQSVLLL